MQLPVRVANPGVTISMMKFNETHQPQMCQDGVVEYARELLSMKMLFLEFRDAIRERDGERVF